MPLTLANTSAQPPHFARENNLPFTVILAGEYQSTDYNQVTNAYDIPVTHDFEVLSFAGVVKMWTEHNVRIMSDVWADTFHCVIALPEGGFLQVDYHANHGWHQLDKHITCSVDRPDLLDAYQAWDKAKREREHAEWLERTRPEREALEARAKKDAERKAKAEAKAAAARAQAEAHLASIVKGMRVRVADKVGEVFWTGVKTYRGKTSARLGVRVGRAHDDVVWCDATEVSPV